MPPVAPNYIPVELIQHLHDGDCILFVGDNLDGESSQSSRLAAAMVDECGGHCRHCQSSQQCQYPDTCDVSLWEAAQLYEKRKSRYDLQKFVLHEIDTDSPPTPLHRALAKLSPRVKVMITTAYDNRLEAALDEQKRKYLSVIQDSDIPFDDPGRIQIIRLHGRISQLDSLVLTLDDSDVLFTRLPTVKNILQAHFASKTLFFVGYNLNDPHFRTLYRQVTGPIAHYQRPAFALQWPPDQKATDIWRGKITLIQNKPLEFLTELVRCVQALQEQEQRATLPPEPYKFLDFYTARDAEIFFGRDVEYGLFLSLVLSNSISIIYGRSGIGKTSLLQARLMPSLEKAGYQVSYMRMLGAPETAVKASLRGVKPADLPTGDSRRHLKDVLADSWVLGKRRVIILDEFEELFIRQNETVQRAFVQELEECIQFSQRAKLDIRFVFSLRDDYLAALDTFSLILPQDMLAHRLCLENLNRDKAELAIVKPAEVFNMPVEEALRSRLLDDLEDHSLETVHFQVVLSQLYQDAVINGLWSPNSQSGTGLCLDRYQALGGVKAILAGYLDQKLAELLDENRREAARLMLKSMITADGMKRAMCGDEIVSVDLVNRSHLSENELKQVLIYLLEKRIMRKLDEGDCFELAHEVIIKKIWNWMSEDELKLFDVRDVIRRSVRDYQKYQLLMSREKLSLLQTRYDEMNLQTPELELILRSALEEQADVPFWRQRAPIVVGRIETELIDSLEGVGKITPDSAIERIVALNDPNLIIRLEQLVDQDFDHQPVICYDPGGQDQEAKGTILNLCTLRQIRAVHAMSRMVLPEAAQVLKRLTPPEMILIPAGPFDMGSLERDEEKPVHEVFLDAFWIDRYPITNAQYAKFLSSGATGRRSLWTKAGWQKHEGDAYPDNWVQDPDPDKLQHPVVGVSWYQSLAYARWMGKRLLSEAQWEKAASWSIEQPHPRDPSGKKHRYPWGDEFDISRCNTRESMKRDTTPVNMYSPAGNSPYGCADMAGNVWEWCSSLYVPYPYRSGDGREGLDGSGVRVVKGGSWDNSEDHARCALRLNGSPSESYPNNGFRCGIAMTKRIHEHM